MRPLLAIILFVNITALHAQTNIIKLDTSSYNAAQQVQTDLFVAATFNVTTATVSDATFVGIHLSDNTPSGGVLKIGIYEGTSLIYATDTLSVSGNDEILGEQIPPGTVVLQNNTTYHVGLIYSGANWLYVHTASVPIQAGVETINSNTHFNTGTVYPTLPDPYLSTNNWGFSMAFILEGCNASSSSITDTVCNSDYTSPSGKIWTSSGIYMDTIANEQGCDSVITIDLTVDTVNLDISITQNGDTLISNADSVSYQWIDCNNGNSPISGATNKSYIVSSSGSYAVSVTRDSCTSTSPCINVVASAINDNTLEKEIEIYPNPTSGKITINSGQITNSGLIKIYNAFGRLVKQVSMRSSITQVNLSDLEKGPYFIQISSKDKVLFSKTIIIINSDN